MDRPERRIILEVASPAVIGQLQAEIDALKKENKDLRSKHNALHDTVYRLMEIVGELRRNKGKS